jgi:hypothetical protein
LKIEVSESDSSNNWPHLVIATVSSVAGLYKGFQKLRRARWLENLPTSLIRSASQGLVELEGSCQALPEGQLKAPLTGKNCVWYRFKVERRGEKSWRRIRHGVGDFAFYVFDDSGQCLVNPADATVVVSNAQVWYGNSEIPLSSDDFLQSAGKYRYSEERIHQDDHLLVMGQFKTASRTISNEITPDLEKMDPLLASSAVVITHTIGKPDLKHLPFLISNHKQTRLIKSLRRGGWFSIGVFFVAGIYAVILLSSRVF